MTKTCKHCGAALEGYETFCPGCGREIPGASGASFRPDSPEDGQPQTDELFPETFSEPAPRRTTARPAQPNPARAPQNRRPAQTRPNRPPQKRQPRSSGSMNPLQRRLILGALAIVAVILLIIGGKMILGGGEDRVVYPFTGVVDQYFAAVRTGNANQYIDTRPPVYTDYLTAGSGSPYGSEPEYRAETAAQLQTRLSEYQAQYGNIRSITYELTDVKQYNHRCEALSNVLSGWYDFPENAVSDAYIVSGTYTVHGAKGEGEYLIDELLLIYTGGSWYFSPDAGSYWRAE